MATAVVEERELLKTISWFDGFVVALANPSFLITGLGLSAFSLGGWGAVILWTVSVILGALHNYIYSETATMFPKLSGGIAIYAHEAWKKYFSFVGPVAAFGYWIGWSVVLSATGVVVGFLVQYEWYPSSGAVTSNWNHSWQLLGQTIYFNFPIALTAVIILVIWAFNVSGMRPAVWVGYVTGALLMLPLAAMMFLPYITGDCHSSNLHNNIHATASSLGASSFTLVIVWLYAMCWSSYGMECCATFAPEYHDTARDTPKALRVAAIFGVITYGLLPMGAMGTFGDQNMTVANLYTFMPQTLHILMGGILAGLAVFSLCAGIVLAMNTATADGSRALYGISQDGMTIRWFGKLNRYHVPANAMTLDALLNILLLLKDRPAWPRPIKVNSIWVGVCGLLFLFDLTILIVGAANVGLAYGASTRSTLIPSLLILVIALGLYVYRVVVQEKKSLQLRLPAATMPEEEALIGAATSTV